MSENYDKEILEQMSLIKKEAKEIKVPESVNPENMMKRIDEMEKKGYFEGEKVINSKDIRDKGKKRRIASVLTGIGATVAVVAMLIAVIVSQPKPVEKNNNTDKETAVYLSTIEMIAQSMKKEVSDGVYVLSSYKELNEYVMAMATKRQSEKDKYGEITYAAIDGDFDIYDEVPKLEVDDEMAQEGDVERPTMSAKPETSTGEGDSTTNTDGDADYSDTNVRTEGVSEADIVKTDGKYIYYLREARENEESAGGLKLVIVSAEGADSKAIATFNVGDTTDCKQYGAELLVTGDKLIAVVGAVKFDDYLGAVENTLVVSYDISDIEKPKLLSTLSLEGRYDSCKMVDGYAYIFAKKDGYAMQYSYKKGDCTEAEVEKIYAPKVCGEYLPAEDVYIADCEDFNQYHIIATLDTAKLDEFFDVKAILGKSGSVNKYVSGGKIYIITDIQDEYTDAFKDTTTDEKVIVNEQSEIMRFSYNEGKIVADGRVVINGSVGDEFDVDEYNGYLRMAVSTRKREYTYRKVDVEFFDGLEWITGSDWDYEVTSYSVNEGSALYIYDDELELVGSIPQLKENEQVYGVRFDGDIGYVVTYEQMDPLFTIDLSDPTNPKVMGALKIPGFSTYLHKWDDNKLIGLGRDEFGQVKISTFDISDKYDVKETDVCSLEDIYWSDALDNHKALLVSPQKNLIGFEVEEYYASEENILVYGFCNVYKIFSYVDGSLATVIECPFEKVDTNVRGMYIGEYIYIVSSRNGVIVYDMADYNKVAHIQ